MAISYGTGSAVMSPTGMVGTQTGAGNVWDEPQPSPRLGTLWKYLTWKLPQLASMVDSTGYFDLKSNPALNNMVETMTQQFLHGTADITGWPYPDQPPPAVLSPFDPRTPQTPRPTQSGTQTGTGSTTTTPGDFGSATTGTQTGTGTATYPVPGGHDDPNGLWQYLLRTFPQLVNYVDKNGMLQISNDPSLMEKVRVAGAQFAAGIRDTTPVGLPGTGTSTGTGSTTTGTQTGTGSTTTTPGDFELPPVVTTPPVTDPIPTQETTPVADPVPWDWKYLPTILRADTKANQDPRGLFTLAQMLPALSPYARSNAIVTLYQNLTSLEDMAGTSPEGLALVNQIRTEYERNLANPVRTPGLMEAYNQQFGGLGNMGKTAGDAIREAGGDTGYSGLTWLKSVGDLGSKPPVSRSDWALYNKRLGEIGNTDAFGIYGQNLANWFAPEQPTVNVSSAANGNLYGGGKGWWQ
jgi:hypothetical protein